MSTENEWVKRNITDEYRVSDIVEQYKSLGFEVKVEDYVADECDIECNTCLTETPNKFKVVYTKADPDFEEDLF